MLRDTAELWPVQRRVVNADAHVFQVWTDDVLTPDGQTMHRTYVRHPSAVAVLALDADERAIVVQQYRHPARMRMVEPPAGLLDHPGEEPLAAAQRELAEETGLAAKTWSYLLDIHATPGSSGENIRVFLARGLHPVATDFIRDHEEADMTQSWIPVDELVAGIRRGKLTSPTLVASVLAYVAFGGAGADFAQPDQPWPGFNASLDDRVQGA